VGRQYKGKGSRMAEGRRRRGGGGGGGRKGRKGEGRDAARRSEMGPLEKTRRTRSGVKGGVEDKGERKTRGNGKQEGMEKAPFENQRFQRGAPNTFVLIRILGQRPKYPKKEEYPKKVWKDQVFEKIKAL
jgi:hypothetical protein